MPYITIRQSNNYKQMTFDDLLSGNIDISTYVRTTDIDTRTVFRKDSPPVDVENLKRSLDTYDHKYNHLLGRSDLYRSFYIPKASGGLRRIDAPEKELMDALRELRVLFEEKFFALYHTSAFAYIRGRGTVSALQRHQSNESRWFLKLDFSNFFSSITHKFMVTMLSTIFPFSEIPLIYLASTILICLLNGGLPQGSPISPMLTNLIMIPIDHAIAVALRHEGHYVYTRYADDLLISSQYSFDKQRVQGLVEDAIFRFQAPLVLNESKTRYGSRSGSNWNLGLMLNKDNEITVGHKKKKYLKAMLDNYMTTKRSGENWSLNDVQALRGLLSYYTMVEPLYTTHLLDAVSSKFGIDILGSIKADLSI